jgi:pyridoxine/pyridoxamine 5'-phosphate oxidase
MQKESAPEQNRQQVIMVARKMPLTDQPTDFAYWQSRPYSERLAALEQIRSEYIRWKYGTDPGFQRVYTIVKR